ncbi:MAG: thioredoxin reductase, partial [Gammaproteobacteria bacterium]|nr:thioredoxin reductase [Gammaproteobacteria bacterium]
AVTGVRIRDNSSGATTSLDVAAVFAYVGLQPNSAVLQNHLRLDADGCVPVDARMRTELKGMLAAGIVRSGASGRAVSSAGDGAIAARTADRYLTDHNWRD